MVKRKPRERSVDRGIQLPRNLNVANLGRRCGRWTDRLAFTRGGPSKR